MEFLEVALDVDGGGGNAHSSSASLQHTLLCSGCLGSKAFLSCFAWIDLLAS